MTIKHFSNWYRKNVVESIQAPEKRLAAALVGTLSGDYIIGLLNRETWRGEALYEECVKFMHSKEYEIICPIQAEALMEGLNKYSTRITVKPSLVEACEGWGISAGKEAEHEYLERHIERVKELAEEGLTREEIAAALGHVSRNSVGEFVKEHCIVIDPSKKGKTAEEKTAVENAKAPEWYLLVKVRESELFALPNGSKGLYVGEKKCEGAKFVFIHPEMVAERGGGFVILCLPEGELQTCMYYNGWLYRHGVVQTAQIAKMYASSQGKEGNKPNGAEN